MSVLRLHALLPRTTRGWLLLLLAVVVTPLVVLQTAMYAAWFYSRRSDELHANAELARAVGVAFEAFLNDLNRQQFIMAAAICDLGPESRDRVAHLLAANADLYQSVTAWHWLGPDGQIRASTDPRRVDQGYPDFPHGYGEALASGKPVLSDLLFLDTATPRFTVSRRVDPQEEEQGVLVAEIEPKRLGQFALRFDRFDEGVATLFDRQGRLVYRFPGLEDIRHELWPGKDSLLYEVLNDHGAHAGEYISPLDGRWRFAARIPLEGSGWLVGASRPVEVAMATVRSSLLWVASLNVVAIVLSIAAAGFIAQRILRPLADLQGLVDAVASGDLQRQTSAGGIAELAQLGEHFNEMARRLHARQEEIDRVVEELRRSNRELEQFAYVASHDLQEPLRVITSYMQLIQARYEGRLDTDADEFIGFIVDAVDRMKQLIADLLEYSRVGMRGRPFEPTNMADVLGHVKANLATLIRETGARITCGKMPTVLADGTQMGQLLQNLVANALKFRRGQPPTVHFSACIEHGRWQFSVADNGIGIELQYRDQIFAIFQRLHTRDKYPGTGIGLAICRRIIERHGGAIWVDSQPGAGSTFRFTLGTEEGVTWKD